MKTPGIQLRDPCRAFPSLRTYSVVSRGTILETGVNSPIALGLP